MGLFQAPGLTLLSPLGPDSRAVQAEPLQQAPEHLKLLTQSTTAM